MEDTLQPIAQLLVRGNLLDNEKALQIQHLATTEKQGFIQFIVANQLFSGKLLATFLSEHFNMPFGDLDGINIAPSTIQLLHPNLIRKHAVLPLFQKDNQLILGVEDPSKESAIREIQFSTDLLLHLWVVESDKLRQRIHTLLSLSKTEAPFQDENTALDSELIDITETAILGEQQDAPIIRFVNKILLEAIKKRASDIHFEPYETTYRIRYRIDGVLVKVSNLPLSLMAKMTARLKILSHLDIAERRIPQDGRFKMTDLGYQEVECRVSTCPTTHGEKVVIRLLDSTVTHFNIHELGMNETQKETFLKAIQRPHGLIMVTGPTGSGKSLTLYNALHLLNTEQINICTVEDPVERRLSGINQVNINPKAGLTFASSLRSFLRQDPDVIMVGEIRDLETAEIAIAAAQTGHLVLSTLHTNNAAASILRLKNMGIPSYNLSSLILLVAQRLVRRLCNACKIRREVSAASLLELGFTLQESKTLHLFQAVGCYQCTHGYKGRIALYELLPINKEIEQLILSGAPSLAIEACAISAGMNTLYRSGLDKVLEGVTSLEEINRMVRES